MSKKLGLATLIGGALFIASGAAQADILTVPQSQSFGPTQTNFTTTLTYNQFDPSLYGGNLLNSLHVQLDGTDLASSTTVTCVVTGGDNHCTGNVSSQITLTLTAPGAGILAVVIPATNFNFDLIGAGSSVVVPAVSNSATVFADFFLSNSTLTAALINDFQGAGTVNLSISGVGSNTITNNDGGSFNFPAITTTGSGTATVTYDYVTPDVPEPATIALLGAGLAGVGVLRRRKKQ